MTARPGTSQRGTALLLVTVLVIVLFGLAGAFLAVRSHYYFTALRDQESEASFVSAESAVDASLNELNAQIDYGGDGLGNVAGSLSDGTYTVALQPPYDGPRRYVLRAVGACGDSARGVLAVVIPEGFPPDRFGSAVFADLLVCVNNGAAVDSYDSRQGDYFLHRKNQFRNTPYTNKNGDVRSNGAVELGANAKVFGTVVSGPQASSSLQSNAHVEASARANAVDALPPIEVPVLHNSGSLTVDGTKSLSGDQRFSSLAVDPGGTLVIRGPATLVLDHFTVGAGATIEIDGRAGPVTIYGTGTFQVDPSASWHNKSKQPSALALRITTDTFENPGAVSIATGGDFYGTVYAPNASLKFDTKSHFFGAVAAKAVQLGIGFKMHYDESLAPAPAGQPTFRLLTMEEVQVKKPPKGTKGK